MHYGVSLCRWAGIQARDYSFVSTGNQSRRYLAHPGKAYMRPGLEIRGHHRLALFMHGGKAVNKDFHKKRKRLENAEATLS